MVYKRPKIYSFCLTTLRGFESSDSDSKISLTSKNSLLNPISVAGLIYKSQVVCVCLKLFYFRRGRRPRRIRSGLMELKYCRVTIFQHKFAHVTECIDVFRVDDLFSMFICISVGLLVATERGNCLAVAMLTFF
jgi:hypothetical protein